MKIYNKINLNKIMIFYTFFLLSSCSNNSNLIIEHRNDLKINFNNENIENLNRKALQKIINPNLTSAQNCFTDNINVNEVYFNKKNNGIVRLGNYLIEFNKENNIKDVVKLDYHINKYIINDDFNGYVWHSIIEEYPKKRYSAISKIINNKISGISFLDSDLKIFTNLSGGELYLDPTENLFYISLSDGRVLFFQDMKLVKEIDFEQSRDRIKININNTKSGLIIFQTAEGNINSVILNNFNILDTHKEIYDFNFIVLDFKIDENGNGIIFYKSQNKIFYKKIKNYKIQSLDIIDSSSISNLKEYTSLFILKADNSGSGYIAWSDKKENIYIKKLNNFILSDSEFKVSTNNSAKSNLSLDFDYNKRIIIAWNEENSEYCNDFVIKSLSSEQIK